MKLTAAFAVPLAITVGILVGCATDPTYSEGKRLVSAGFPEDGLTLLEKAMRDNPGDRELRMEWLRQRDALVGKLLTQAEQSRAAGQIDDAAAAFSRALRIDPDNARARAGVASIDAERRHAQWVRDAEELMKKKDFPGAEAKLRAVLVENAAHPQARITLRRAIDAAASASLAAPVLKSAIGKPVTLEFREANLRAVFDAISRTTGINFVFDKDVRADLRTTIVVRNSTVDDVIKLVLVTNQLERKVLNDNTLLIYPNTPAKLKEYQELVVRSFYVANADVKQILAMIRSVVKTRDLYVDDKLGILVMKDTLEAVRLAEKLIAAQDLADPEVTLELEVLEVGTSRLQELGVRYPDRVFFQDPVTVGSGLALQRATGPLTGFIATPAFILNLRQQDGTTNVLANPRIRVKNREKARVHIGDRVPVITTTSTANVGVSSSVTYLDVGLKLEVEPTVHLEGEVAIKVGLEVSNIVKEVPVSGGGIAYQIGTRNAATVLRLKDGETQVLAGLIQDDERVTANKVPMLGDLPVVGRLFSSNVENRSKNEIVLLMTPRIVRSLYRPEHVVAEYYSGTEAMVGASPLAIRPTGPSALSIAPTPGGAGPGPAPKAAIKPPGQPVAIQFNAPAQAVLGRQFTLTVSLSADPRGASAQLEIAYDPAVLAPQGTPADGRTGRHVLTLGGDEPRAGSLSATVAFQVLAKTPTSTRLAIENVVVRDAGGDAMPAAVPPPRAIDIVQAAAESKPDARPEPKP